MEESIKRVCKLASAEVKNTAPNDNQNYKPKNRGRDGDKVGKNVQKHTKTEKCSLGLISEYTHCKLAKPEGIFPRIL